MSPTTQEIQVQNLDHLGIVAGIIDEIGLVDQVDELLGIHPQEVVTLGQILKAMILNGLGLSVRHCICLVSSLKARPLSIC
jgi:Domain of unknown function (DUF4277)